MRSFSIFCARTLCSRPATRLLAWTLAAAVALLAAPAEAKKGKKKDRDPEELFNPLLGIEYAHWLVGPIYEMASEEEIAAYLDFVDDEEAKAFIEAFWKERNAGTGFFEDSPEESFSQRAHVADGRYTEGALPGRRTDRGTTFILYGEPEEIEYESSDKVGGAPLEVWKYPEDAEAGLHGETPKKSYRFIEVGGHTVFYNQQALQRREIEDRRKLRKPRYQ